MRISKVPLRKVGGRNEDKVDYRRKFWVSSLLEGGEAIRAQATLKSKGVVTQLHTYLTLTH